MHFKCLTQYCFKIKHHCLAKQFLYLCMVLYVVCTSRQAHITRRRIRYYSLINMIKINVCGHSV